MEFYKVAVAYHKYMSHKIPCITAHKATQKKIKATLGMMNTTQTKKSIAISVTGCGSL
jgi:hypothetical protein